jgi:hypothetical protein
MYLYCHGGKCCGIRHIHSIGNTPSYIVEALPKEHDLFTSDIGGGEYRNPGKSFFVDGAPEEKAWRRLDRFLAYCDRRRPHGIVEVVVISAAFPWQDQPCHKQHRNWRPVLLKRGFKEVNTCRNSNSDHRLHIYHRNSGEVPVIKLKKEKKSGKVNQAEGGQVGVGEAVEVVSEAVGSPFD